MLAFLCLTDFSQYDISRPAHIAATALFCSHLGLSTFALCIYMCTASPSSTPLLMEGEYSCCWVPSHCIYVYFVSCMHCFADGSWVLMLLSTIPLCICVPRLLHPFLCWWRLNTLLTQNPMSVPGPESLTELFVNSEENLWARQEVLLQRNQCLFPR